MGEKELRRSMAVLPMSVVMKLTDLTARQIRYYEKQELITAERNSGNQRIYSLNDIDLLLEIKDLITDGLNIVDIKLLFESRKNGKNAFQDSNSQLSDDEARRLLRSEIIKQSGLGGTNNPFQSNLF